MALIGWHTQFASSSRPGKGPCACGLGSREELDTRRRQTMTSRLSLLVMLFGLIAMGRAPLAQANGELLGFAVVSEVPKDKARV